MSTCLVILWEGLKRRNFKFSGIFLNSFFRRSFWLTMNLKNLSFIVQLKKMLLLIYGRDKTLKALFERKFLDFQENLKKPFRSRIPLF